MANLLVQAFPPMQQRAITMIAAGHIVPKIAEELNLCETTIYKWRQNPDFLDAAAELSSQAVEYALMHLSTQYTTLIEEITNIATDPTKGDSDRLRALNMLTTKIESLKKDKDARDVRLLTRLLQDQPTDDSDLYRESQERIQEEETSTARRK